MSESEALRNRMQTVGDTLASMEPQIKHRLAGMIDPKKFIGVVMTSVQTNPKLLKCTPMSFYSCVLQVAELGLSTNTNTGEAYLIPFKNTKKGTVECQLVIGYRGLIKLAHRSGKVSDIFSILVYEKEPFEVKYGNVPEIKHTPLPPKERGKKIKAVYAIAVLKDGTRHIEMMWADEIEAIRKRSPAGRTKGGVWDTDTDAMYQKSPIRKIAKFVPISTDLATAVTLDEMADAGLAQVAPLPMGQLTDDTPVLPESAEYEEEEDEPADSPPEKKKGKKEKKKKEEKKKDESVGDGEFNAEVLGNNILDLAQSLGKSQAEIKKKLQEFSKTEKPVEALLKYQKELEEMIPSDDPEQPELGT